jgi:anti-sigma factor RsiW
MNCQEVTLLLSDYMDHRLSPKVEAAARVHLGSCSACRIELEDLENTVKLLGSFENRRLSQEFDARLLSRMDAAGAPLRPGAGAMSHSILQLLRGFQGGALGHSPIRWAVTAAALAGVGIASWQLYPARPQAKVYIAACVQAHASFTPPPAQLRIGAVQDPNPDVDIANAAVD